MKHEVYVSKEGQVSVAVGDQPKDALLFAPSKKSTGQIVREHRSSWRKNIALITERLHSATDRT